MKVIFKSTLTLLFLCASGFALAQSDVDKQGVLSQTFDRLSQQGITGSGDKSQASEKLDIAAEKILSEGSPADADADVPTDITFEEWVDAFKEELGVEIGETENGRLFLQGSASVRVGPEDPNFGKALVIAYEEAITNMQADFILQNYGQLTSERLFDLVSDQSSNNSEFEPLKVQESIKKGRFEALFDKALTLAGKKLDAELLRQGVPQADLNRTTLEQKKILLKDNFTKEVMKEAVRSMQGLVPVQTRVFTRRFASGVSYSVGVIGVQSTKTRQFAMDMAAKRPTLVRGTFKPLEKILPAKKSEYLNELGYRFTYDRDGRPMLLSYGRWSVSILPDWTPARTSKQIDIAKRTARALAEASIVEFMNTNVQIQQSNKIGALEEELVTKITDLQDGKEIGSSKVATPAVAKIIDTFKRQGRTFSSGDLRGTSLRKSWDLPGEGGVHNVGVVVTWTFKELNNANEIDRQSSEDKQPRSGQAKKSYETGNSKLINRKEDF